jgi:hypothetical protein
MILNLIIASTNRPFYPMLMHQWRRYMNIHPDVVSYFLVNDSSKFVGTEKSATHKFENEFLYFNAPETGIPGIFEKTVKAVKLFSESEEIWGKIDFVIRTNLSSFYIWDRLVEYLHDTPRTGFAGGGINATPTPAYISGCGMILSKDVCKLLVDNFHHPLKNLLDDDRMIGYLMHYHSIPLVPIARHNMPSQQIVEKTLDTIAQDIPPHVFHVRTRCGTNEFRLHVGTQVYRRFVDYWYANRFGNVVEKPLV